MKKLSMLELRTETKEVIRLLRQKRQRIRLTYRGKPLADLVPVDDEAAEINTQDAFYTLCDRAVAGDSLSNSEMDRALYEEE